MTRKHGEFKTAVKKGDYFTANHIKTDVNGCLFKEGRTFATLNFTKSDDANSLRYLITGSFYSRDDGVLLVGKPIKLIAPKDIHAARVYFVADLVTVDTHFSGESARPLAPTRTSGEGVRPRIGPEM